MDISTHLIFTFVKSSSLMAEAYIFVIDLVMLLISDLRWKNQPKLPPLYHFKLLPLYQLKLTSLCQLKLTP